MMNQEQIKGKLKQLEGIAKQQWSKLKDEDFREGSLDRIAGRITELYGITRAEAQKKLNELMDSLEDMGNGASKSGNVHKMADKLSHYAEQGQKELEEVADSIKNQSREWYEYMDKSIKEKPLTTLAVALGLGALLGSLIRR